MFTFGFTGDTVSGLLGESPVSCSQTVVHSPPLTDILNLQLHKKCEMQLVFNRFCWHFVKKAYIIHSIMMDLIQVDYLSMYCRSDQLINRKHFI